MSMAVPIVMAVVSMAAAAAQAAAQASQAEAADAANEMNTNNNNFRSKWAKEDENFNRFVAFQTRLERNLQIERAAAREKASAEVASEKVFDNQRSQVSKDSMIANEMFLSTATGRSGLSANSGTIRAVLRQNLSAMKKNMTALRINEQKQNEQIDAQYMTRLASRDYSGPQAVSFIPAPVVKQNSSGNIWASNLLMGAVQGASIIGGAYMGQNSMALTWGRTRNEVAK